MNETVPSALDGLLHLGRQAYIALDDDAKVHVTPVLYAWTDGRLWFAAAADTRKVRLLRDTGRAVALVQAGNRWVLLIGAADVVDPARPATLLALPRELSGRAQGLALYGLRNLSDLAGFARDALMLRNGRLRPRRRVFVGLRPAGAVLFDGARPTGAWGDWPGGSLPAEAGAAPVAEGTSAVLGWRTRAGAVALPAHWAPARSAAAVAPAVVALLGAVRHSPACLVVDDYGGAGPSPKRGTMLHGTGELIADDSGTWAQIEPERLAGWSGAATGSRATGAG